MISNEGQQQSSDFPAAKNFSGFSMDLKVAFPLLPPSPAKSMMLAAIENKTSIARSNLPKMPVKSSEIHRNV
jgi:hypothetical protein